MTDETAIISRIRQGDEKAFKYLFEHYYAAMCSFARHIVHDGHLAESIVDDVVFNIWENRRSLHVKSSLRTYLLSAVRYRCINEIKSPYRMFSRMQTTIPPGDSTDFVMSLFADARHPLGELIEKELQDIIRESIDELPDECRRVFLKSRTEHMTNNAIFLIETVWKKIESKELLKELGCRMAFKGVITNKRQFTQLEGTTSAEDTKLLYDRTSAMQKLKTNIEQEVKSSESK